MTLLRTNRPQGFPTTRFCPYVAAVADLAELLSILEDHVEVPEEFADLVEYKVFAVQHRYLPFGGELCAEERGSMLGRVRDVLTHVERLLAGAETSGNSE